MSHAAIAIAPPRRASARRLRLAKQFRPVWLLAPAMAAIALTTAYPLISALLTSFHLWKLNVSAVPGRFVGLHNYALALDDPDFLNAVVVTVIYTIVSVTLSIVAGFAIALLLNRDGVLPAIAKATLILPYAVAPALKGFSWRFMLDPAYGIYPFILRHIFPPLGHIDWIGNPVGAMLMLAMTEAWGWSQLIALMLLGGLAALPPEVHEAARIDGATPLQSFLRITLPMLRPLLLVIVFLKVMSSVKLFDQVVTATNGGPGRSTQTVMFYIYEQGFSFLNLGYASALAWLLVLVLGVLAVWYLRVMTREQGL